MNRKNFGKNREGDFVKILQRNEWGKKLKPLT